MLVFCLQSTLLPKNILGKKVLTHLGFLALEPYHIQLLEHDLGLHQFVLGEQTFRLDYLEVTDQRNIGSVIRSAASFNIDGLIVKERHFHPNEITEEEHKMTALHWLAVQGHAKCLKLLLKHIIFTGQSVSIT